MIDCALLRARPLPVPAAGSKDARGAALVVAGAACMPGTAILAGEAALRAGAGKLQIATAAANVPVVGAQVPEALVIALPQARSGAVDPRAADEIAARARGADAVTIGPGLIDEESTAVLVRAVLAQLATAVVVDAAAISACTGRDALGGAAGRAIMTPHAGELAALLDVPREDIEADAERYARETAARLDLVVVLKGATTYVAAGDDCFVNEHGHIGLATSGSGDVLAGIIGGLLARGAPPLDAALWGVAVHARAGSRLGARIGTGFLARELPGQVPALLRDLSGQT